MDITKKEIFLAILPGIYERKVNLTGTEVAKIADEQAEVIMSYLKKASKSQMLLEERYN